MSSQGIIYHVLNRYKESFVDFNKLLEIEPNNAKVLSNWEITYSGMGKYKE